MVNAESIGRYYNQYIKGSYYCERIYWVNQDTIKLIVVKKFHYESKEKIMKSDNYIDNHCYSHVNRVGYIVILVNGWCYGFIGSSVFLRDAFLKKRWNIWT
jgi:hypothetical protein